MTSMMVVVSKSVFSKMENAEGETPALGDVLKHRRYESRHRSLDQLSRKGAIFLVTARPKDRLWLLAIVEKPKADEDGWQGQWNKTPVTDVTKLIKKLKFSTGKGINAKPGKLGMSLQTPRVLTENDVALLRDTTPAKKKEKKKATKKTAKKKKATKKKVAKQKEGPIDLVIPAAHAKRIATIQAWRGATSAQRKAVAKAIETAAAQCGLRFVSIEKHAVPIAVFDHAPSKMRFCLIPGGEYVRGFSKREEKLVREAADDNEGIGSHFEEYGALFEQMNTMRPCNKVTVGAFLIAQKAVTCEVDELEARLAASPFRLPTEAQHERAQRGLPTSDLTWDGHVIPDEKWFKKASKKKNDFGLVQVGFDPEVCADVFSPDHKRAPKTGPRKGKGPRVVRGGAAMLYPWQDCGEWHMLLNAFRSPADIWEFEVAFRPALGIA